VVFLAVCKLQWFLKAGTVEWVPLPHSNRTIIMGIGTQKMRMMRRTRTAM